MNWIELLIIFGLSVLNGVFSLSETAVIAARKARLQQLIDKGDENARAALELAEEPNRFLSTVQIGITLIGQVSGAFAGATLAEELAASLENTAIAPYASALSFALVVLLTTYLSLIIGELVPKRLALQSPERIASIVAPPMRVLERFTAPVVSLLSASTTLVLRIMGVKDSEDPPVSEDEIKAMIQQGIEAGVFEENEHDMVEGVFRLDMRRVTALMTPRTELVWLDINDSDEENQRKIMDNHYSRFPVCDGDLDHIIGILRAKDMLGHLFAGKPFDLRAVMIEPIFVPESMSAAKLLELLRTKGRRTALVIGEYGGLEGLVTIHDVLSEIVDMQQPLESVQREDGSWLVDGITSIDDFREMIDFDEIPGENDAFKTLAGFVLHTLGRIPKTGDSFMWEGYKFEVIDMDGNRVDKILVQPPPADDPTEAKEKNGK